MKKNLSLLALAILAMTTMTGCMPYVKIDAGFQPLPSYQQQYPSQYGYRPVMVVKETTVERRRVPNSPPEKQQQPTRTFELFPMDGD